MWTAISEKNTIHGQARNYMTHKIILPNEGIMVRISHFLWASRHEYILVDLADTATIHITNS